MPETPPPSRRQMLAVHARVLLYGAACGVAAYAVVRLAIYLLQMAGKAG